MSLFQRGEFTLASGRKTGWKIECDALTDEDWATLAYMIVGRHSFSGVTGVPQGGLKLAELLKPYANPSMINHLIVDDVYTTGGSIRSVREQLILQPGGGDRYYCGVVVFARGPLNPADAWVGPMFPSNYL